MIFCLPASDFLYGQKVAKELSKERGRELSSTSADGEISFHRLYTFIKFLGMFCLRASYFPSLESSQSSPDLRARTQESGFVTLASAAGAVPS